jgi:alpha-tubulin suppressor-like RCC1 family protein
MAYLNKLKLSESAFGRGVKVWGAHSDFDTLLHNANCGAKDVQELWLWAHNESDSPVDLYICVYKPNSNEKTSFKTPIPAGLENLPTLVSPGLVIKNDAKVKAYSNLSDAITIYGYINQLNQTDVLAQLEGFGSNAYGESNHPNIGGRDHEILFNENGGTLACGNQFNLAIRPNGTVFSWGQGNIVNQLLQTGSSPPWGSDVDTYGVGGDLAVASDGIPAHDTPYKNLNASNPGNNPNKASRQDHFFLFPTVPTIVPVGPQIPRGNIGVAVNGIPFDTRTAEVWSGMQQWEEAGGPGHLGVDNCGGHVQPGGKYHYHTDPKCLYTVDTGEHSPIIGYAFDGLPIYGPIGYANQTTTGSGVSVMTSSYRLKQGNRPYGSGIGPGGVYDGTYTADYEYVSDLGDLDRSNARFAITPQHSTGSWHYHITATGVSGDFHGVPVYPFIIGPTFKGTPKECNFSGTCERPIVFPPKGLGDVSKVVVGENHAIALKKDESIVAWGDNSYGQCQPPSQLSNGVTDIAVGANHSLAIQVGKVVAWGRNNLGQVDGIPAPRSVSGVIMTNSGDNYSLTPTVVIDGGGGEGAAGEAVLAGRPLLELYLETGSQGGLGQYSDDLYTEAPTITFEGGGGQGASGYAVLTSSSANPAFGYVSNIVLTDSGSGYTSAPNVRFIDDSSACLTQGVCGTGASGFATLSLTQVSGVILSNQGNGYSSAPTITFINDGNDTEGGDAEGVTVISGVESGLAYPLSIGGEEVSGATRIAGGYEHSLAIISNSVGDKIFGGWGNGSEGQLNAPTLLEGQTPIDVKAGGYHGLAIIYDATENQNFVESWGATNIEYYGQATVPNYAKLGDTNTIGTQGIQIQGGLHHSLILNPDGTVSGFGNDSDGRTTGGSSLTNVNSIMSGPTSKHSFATINDVSSKRCLLRSSGGEGIIVDQEVLDWKTCAEKTHIHRTNDNPDGVEELWLWAHNSSATTGYLEISMEPKEVGIVSSISMVDGGAGYDSNPTVLIEGGGGRNANAAAEMLTYAPTDTTGYIGNLTMLAVGSGYFYEPKITFTGGASDPDVLVSASAKAVIETGEVMHYSVPPRSGLYLLQPGYNIENLHNVRAAVDSGHLNDIQIYGYVNRLEKGVQGTSSYYDNPYQISGSLDCMPLTALAIAAASGETTLVVRNEDGFTNGNVVTINLYGNNEETVTITGFGASFKISGSGGDSGLFQDHLMGERIMFAEVGSVGGGASGDGGNGNGGDGGDGYGGDPPGGP